MPTIPDLPDNSTITGADEIPIQQSGVTRRVRMDELWSAPAVVNALPAATSSAGAVFPVVQGGVTKALPTAVISSELDVTALTYGQIDVGNRIPPVTGNLGLNVSMNVANPNDVIQQHFVGYSFYHGPEGPSTGSYQGGSCEAQVWLDGYNYTQSALGFEGIGTATGNGLGNSVAQIIGTKGTAWVRDTCHVGRAIGLLGDASIIGGASTVDDMVACQLQTPAGGTNNWLVWATNLKITAAGQVRAASLGVGNSVAATTAVGALARKIQVFDAAGVSLGYVPVYAAIT